VDLSEKEILSRNEANQPPTCGVDRRNSTDILGYHPALTTLLGSISSPFCFNPSIDLVRTNMEETPHGSLFENRPCCRPHERTRP
jgi:hypothetical protein